MKPQSPCLNCIDRYYKCHAYCEKYILFRQNLNEFNLKQIQEKQEYIESIKYEAEKKRRLNKYKK